MNVQAEVSLYPLRSPNLSEPIAKFCETLMKSGLSVEIASMSTSLSGEVGQVFDGLKSAMVEIGQDHEVVLVVKISNACPEDPVSKRRGKPTSRAQERGPMSRGGRASSMKKE